MAAVTYVSSSADKAATNSLTVAAPASIADGDILLAYGWNYHSGSRVAMVPPVGFSEIVLEATLSNKMMYFWWKRAASESGDYTFTADAATVLEAHILVFRGCNPIGSPVDVYSDTPYITSNATVRAASMTTTRPGARVWAGCCVRSAPTLSLPAGWTAAQSVISGNYRSTTGYVCDADGHVEGATGDQDGTVSGGATTDKHGLMVQLQVPPDPYVTLQPDVAVPLPLVTPLGNIMTCAALFNDWGAAHKETEDVTVLANARYPVSAYVYAPVLGSDLTITVETGHSTTLATLTATSAGWVRYHVPVFTAAGETTLHLKFAFAGGGDSQVFATGAMVRA